MVSTDAFEHKHTRVQLIPLANDDIYFAFQSTGDFVYGSFIKDLEYLLDQDVRVSLYYGDADYICKQTNTTFVESRRTLLTVLRQLVWRTSHLARNCMKSLNTRLRSLSNVPTRTTLTRLNLPLPVINPSPSTVLSTVKFVNMAT